MNEEKRYQIALTMIPGVGDILTKQLISYCGSARAVFEGPKAKLKKIPGVGDKLISTIHTTNLLARADEHIENCLKQQVTISFYTDSDYPTRLKRINDAPPLIYWKGKKPLDFKKTVGIVGTRNATQYGKSVVEEICAALASQKSIATVSGLAYGIDIAAHRASLKNNIPSIGVLAGGLDKIYPAVHSNTALEMTTEGALLSENPLGTKPDAHLFPARNRIIAGLSDALIVVEAAEKGGALITANIAYSYDKDVFAVPGNINNTYSAGCNKLITTQRAIPYTRIEDLLSNMNWDMDEAESKRKSPDFSQFSAEERKVLSILQESPAGIMIDQLAWKSQVTINQLASVLLNLEFKGAVKSLPGKKYSLA